MAETTRGPKPKLTRELLIATALRIAETEGLEALSMRRLGAELDVDPMAAYRHLPNKKALLTGIVEAVLAGADLRIDFAEPWQEQFRHVARAYREAMAAHSPAVARLVATTPYNSVASLRIVEQGAAILVAAGVPLEDSAIAIQAVGQIASGAVMLEAFWREHAAAGGQVYLYPPSLPDPDLPVLSKVAASGGFRTPREVFEFGLRGIIEHLETLTTIQI